MSVLVLSILWFLLSFVIASAASQRGRNAFAWFLLSIATSPVLAALFLLLFPAKEAVRVAVSDIAVDRSDEGTRPSRTGGYGIFLVAAAFLAVLVVMANHQDSNQSSELSAAVRQQADGPEHPLATAASFETVAAMPCVSFSNALGTGRFSELTDPLVPVINRRGGLGSTVNMTSYILTECRLRENQTIGQVIESLFEQKRLGRLPSIPIGGATNEAYIRAAWTPFEKWIRHQGPRPNLAELNKGN